MKKKFLKKLLQRLCVHDWVVGDIVRKYNDYSGFPIADRKCYCPKCGKYKIRKYW